MFNFDWLCLVMLFLHCGLAKKELLGFAVLSGMFPGPDLCCVNSLNGFTVAGLCFILTIDKETNNLRSWMKVSSSGSFSEVGRGDL